jgi:hypothetical protein
MQVVIIITGSHKAFALYKAVEEGVNHMWTVSAIQMHKCAMLVCDDSKRLSSFSLRDSTFHPSFVSTKYFLTYIISTGSTGELRVKTVKYFKSLDSHWDNKYYH